MGDFMFGMSKVDITPELGCGLGGYSAKRNAERVLDPLAVGAAAFKQDGTTFIWMTADVCSIGPELSDEIRDKIESATGICRDNIIQCTMHNHSGPMVRTSAGWSTINQSYVNDVFIPANIKAAQQALASMQPAVMGVGSAQTKTGVNRREIAADGTVFLGQNPDAPYDPTMTVMSFKSLGGANIGTIVHFASHATVCGPNLSITRDWPGVMIDRIESITNAPCIFSNGAEGDIGPRISDGKTDSCEEFLPEVGNIAADDAQKALESITDYIIPSLRVYTEDMLIPYGEPEPLETVKQSLSELGDPKKLEGRQHRTYVHFKEVLDMYERGYFPKGMPYRQTVFSLGDLALIPMPFEAFCEIALRLREKSPFKETLVIGLANGCNCYVPMEEQMSYGGYEVEMFFTSKRLSFIKGLDKYLVDENVKLLNKLKGK